MTRAPDTIGEMMTREVVTVAPDEPVERAVHAMLEHDIGSVVVAEGRLPVGVFTERDLTRRIPVVDGGELVDIVTERNLLHWVGQVAKE